MKKTKKSKKKREMLEGPAQDRSKGCVDTPDATARDPRARVGGEVWTGKQ